MAVFTYDPLTDKYPDMWISDNQGNPDKIVNNTAYLGVGTQYTIHHPGVILAGGGAGGLANANSVQPKPPKNHPKQPSIVPTNAIYEPVGSSVTVSPYGEGEDIDWLVWFDTEKQESDFILQLIDAGFTTAGTQGYDPDMFVSYKKGTENYILTDKADFFDKFIKARNLCQFLNLKSKVDRIVVHNAIMKNEFPSFNSTPFASCGYGKEDLVW
jgi:hypothetical protein